MSRKLTSYMLWGSSARAGKTLIAVLVIKHILNEKVHVTVLDPVPRPKFRECVFFPIVKAASAISLSFAMVSTLFLGRPN